MHFIKFEETQYDLKGHTLQYISDLKNMLS